MGAAQEAGRRLPPGGPPISQGDLAGFFQSHFSSEAVANFEETFQNLPAFQQSYGQVEHHDMTGEDDLGYYEDGVKRTLTDEQIEMFRQSELRELRRNQERQTRLDSQTPCRIDLTAGSQGRAPSSLSSSTRGAKKKKKKGAAKPRYEPKPDLRKRTWDVVEPGLDTLEYD
ncbi:hypothetical protein CDD83_767 [Cordyceps sp. RAO-2017]|nr:hypothetical protein CDD83_767 [Cordyceps sp. RAO-2017]